MKRTLAGRAAETYVLASAEKLGAASRYQVLPVSAVSGIITDDSLNDTITALAGQGVTVLGSGHRPA
jgi:DeoR/GlpR family transcriptional regulator of sugar metabolism